MSITKLPSYGMIVKLTYYWIALRPTNDPDEVPIKECKTGRVLTMASRAWKAKADVEGTARFKDKDGNSRTINVGDNESCWEELTDHESRWGVGVWDKAHNESYKLRPFRSIAVDPKMLTIGKWYYIKELDGLQMPYPLSTLKHDGRVRAVDVGPDIKGTHIDFFVGYERAYNDLSRRHGKLLDHVTIFEDK